MHNAVTSDTRKILGLALPLISAMLTQKALQVLSTLMLGLLGTNALAAGILSTSAYMAILVIGLGTLNALGILIAQSHGGAENKEKVAIQLQQGFYVSLILTIPCMLVIWYMPYLFLISGQEKLLVALAGKFLHAMLWGFPALLGFLTLREFVCALNRPKITAVISALALPLNAILSYILMYGKLGFPALSITGIGIANAVTEWMMFISLFIYIKKHALLNSYAMFFKCPQINWPVIREIFRIGLPNAASVFLEVMACSVLVLMMGHFGAVALAAHQIAFQCATIAYMFPMGISVALSLIISQKIGAQETQQLPQIICTGLIIAAFFSAIIIGIFLLLPQFIVQLFIHDNQSNFLLVKNLAIHYLFIAALLHLFDMLQTILFGCLRGFKDTFIPMLICLFSYLLIMLGVGYLLAFRLHLGGSGLWWGASAGLAFSSLLLGWRLWLRIRSQFPLSRMWQSNAENTY